MSLFELTEAEIGALEFIDFYYQSEGYPPTVREITDAIEVRSTSTTHLLLKSLQDKGYITMEYQRARTIRLTDRREQACA